MDINSELQAKYSSSFDEKKICSYNVEEISSPTNPIMHQESRFLFFIEGKGTIKINNICYDIKPYSCVAIVPWTITEVTDVIERLQFIKIVYNFNYFNQSIKSTYNTLDESIDIISELSNNPIVYANELETKKIIRILNDLKSEISMESVLDIRKEQILSNAFISNKIMEMIIWYIRQTKNKNLKITKIANNDLDKRVTIFKYLYSHLSEKPTLKSVSTKFYISESTLSKYCKKIIGVNFHDLLNEMRLIKTMDFLLYSDFSLNIIAELVGFNDASHLSNFFTKRMGSTPNQYRKINKDVFKILNPERSNLGYEVINYITVFFMEDISEVVVAKKFDMSVQELNRILQYTVEKNFDELISFLRINHACKLLKTTDNTILDIAITVGYNNVKTFNNHFIKLKNMNPSKFRKEVNIQYDYE
ncbi:helix-turn-helix domain-containing protein [Anaerosphaera multitolerans]|uniref:AraC family transcriptional regulator n=1 Tax=Anaerosphaera multitolerans TaxID=2487351 RepID=A0A437S5B0_9FIRM|nr:AraC family transcriptional regulator [Anaerosphaera multitolerans]RVU54157.1 AraC family transcriptional regulator [Anaerosphaera multitolerans]